MASTVMRVTAGAAAVPSRRQRRREATSEEILAVAAEMLGREGGAGLTIRSIARELGLAPSALYRYYPSRDAILTALIARAFVGLGDAVGAAARSCPDSLEATLAACHAFRNWALAHPHEFGLIFGTPVPGYAWPEDMNLYAVRVEAELLDLLRRGLADGNVRIPADDQPAALAEALGGFVALAKFEPLTPVEAAAALQFWLLLLGTVTGELFGHLPPAIIELGTAFFDHTIRRALLALGCSTAALTQARSPLPEGVPQ